MNIGLSEIMVILIILVLLAGVPLLVVLAAWFLFRRMRALEERLEKLETNQGSLPAKGTDAIPSVPPARNP